MNYLHQGAQKLRVLRYDSKADHLYLSLFAFHYPIFQVQDPVGYVLDPVVAGDNNDCGIARIGQFL